MAFWMTGYAIIAVANFMLNMTGMWAVFISLYAASASNLYRYVSSHHVTLTMDMSMATHLYLESLNANLVVAYYCQLYSMRNNLSTALRILVSPSIVSVKT